MEDFSEEMNDVLSETKIVFKDNLQKNNRQISEEELHSIYLSFDIDLNQNYRKYNLWRLEVIHIRGVQDMSSEDVLKYFDEFEPISIEWVNDLSCNIVFNDRKCAAIAMRDLTTALIIKISKHNINTDLDIEVIDADSLSVPIPPQFRWRLGKSVHKSKALLLRFATEKDKKMMGSRPLNQYYVKYGISRDISDTTPNRKRRYKWGDREDSPEHRIETNLMNIKRFRMRADDEQQLIQNRKTVKSRISDDRTRKSIWDRLDNHSFGNDSAKDTDLLQIAVDVSTKSRQTFWKERPLRSAVSLNKNTNLDKNDLRTKLKKTSFDK